MQDIGMRLATREQIELIDQATLKQLKITSSDLIARASAALSEKFLSLEFVKSLPVQARVGIWCGPGKNGADGRGMGKLLMSRFKIQVLDECNWAVRDFDCIIDAYFGIGLNRAVPAEVAVQIEKINRSQVPVIAIDVPSGLDANRGLILGSAVRAMYTLTILPAKPGLFLNDGPKICGRIRGVDIGIPENIFDECAKDVSLFGAREARLLLKPRPAKGNKTSFGNLLIIAGSRGMEGAALLTAEAAARMGCGYVSLCSFSDDVFKMAKPDFLRLSPADFLSSDLKKYSAVVIGPGLGVNEKSGAMIEHLHKNHGKVLADADALTSLAKISKVPLPTEWLLTPHAGELARLLHAPAKDLENDRLGSVQRAAHELNAHILFKGFRTVLGKTGRSWVVGSGNVALAKAGTGDVLAGFIGSLMAQGHSTQDAALLGAYLHGRIADDWLRRGHSTRTLMASDLAELLDASLRSLKKSGS